MKGVENQKNYQPDLTQIRIFLDFSISINPNPQQFSFLITNSQKFMLIIIKRLKYNMTTLQNPAPKLYKALKLTFEQQQARRTNQFNPDVQDTIDQLQVFDLVRHINDPEYPLTLEQLNVVNLQRCYVNKDKKVEMHFTPTIPHCSMAQMIGLMIKVKLSKFLPPKFKIKVIVTDGTHVNENEINKQINDKERISAAIQNPNIGRVMKRGFHNSDRFQF